MPITPSAISKLVGSRQKFHVTPDNASAQEFTSDFAVADVAATNGGIIENFVVQTGAGSFATFEVLLPSSATSVVVTVTASGVTGLASNLTSTVTVLARAVKAGRAAANPAAKNYGTNIVAVCAEQYDYFVPREFPNATPSKAEIAAVGGYPNVIEFRPPYTLQPIKQFYPVQRQKGNPSPDPSIPGMQMGGGELHFYLDPTLVPFWLKHLLHLSSDVPGVSFGNYTPATAVTLTLPAGTASTFGSPDEIAAAAQPKMVLQDGSSFTDPTPPRNMIACRIRLTFASSDADIRVQGTDHNGAAIEDISTSSAARTTFTTKRYYADNIRVSKKGAGTLSVTRVEYILDDATTGQEETVYEHTLNPTNEVNEGLTLEVHEGNRDTPITYNGTLLTRGVIRLEDVARAQFQVISNQALPRRSMHDSDFGTALDNFERLDFHAVPNLGMSWELSEDDPNIPADFRGIWRAGQLGFAMDNRIAPPRTSFAEDFDYPKPVRKLNRELQMQVEIDHSKEADFDSFVGGLNFKSIISATSRPYGGAYRAIRAIMNNSQMVGNPRRSVNQLEEIVQMIPLRANIAGDPTGNDEVEFRVINTQETF